MDVKNARELVSQYIRDTFPKTFVARGMQWDDMPPHIEAKVIELSKTKAPGEIQAQLMKEGLIPKSKATGGKAETRGMKSFMEGLKNQGKIETVLKDPLGSLTALEQTRRDKIVREFIKTNPDITNSFQIAKRINSFNPDLGLSRNFVESAIKREGLDTAIQNRFEVIFDDIKAIDKVIKKNSNIVLNERVSWKKRVEDLTNLYQKETGKPMEIAIDEFGARLTRLGNLYAGTGGDRYATKLYDTIKAPANYMNSKFQKQLIAISSASNKTLSNSEMARLLGLPAKEIELIDNTSAMMRSFPFKVAGDHTDIKSLMKEDIKNYKKNFTRIEHIKNSLNQYKRTYDVKIKNLYDRAKGASPAAKAIFLEQAKELEDKFQRNTNYRIGNFNIKDGRLVIDPKTPRIGSFDSPLNRYLQQSMRNFETTINPKLKSIPETKVTKFTNPIDKQYMSADQKEIKKIFEYADKNPKIAKESQVLKSFSKVPGKVGKAARLIIAGGAGATAVATVANAADGTEAGSMLPEAAAGAGVVGGAYAARKPIMKAAGTALRAITTPLGAGALWGATGFDKESAVDRATLGAEAAFAPELVRQAGKLTKPIKNKALRTVAERLALGLLTPATAFRLARIASPIGWATLGAEGLYQLGKYAIKEHKRFKALSPEEQAAERAEQEAAVWNEPMAAAEGGRVGFDKGSKPKSPGRRAFIKGVTAAATLPFIGKYFKLGKVLEKAQPYLGPTVEKIKGMPEWFPGLVKRLWNEGEDVTKQLAYKDRQVVKRGTLEGGDDVDLIYDLDTGDVSINVTPKKGTHETSSGAYNKEYSLDYQKGQADEMTKGKKPPDDFTVSELEPRQMSPEDIELDGTMTTVDDALTDLTELEAFAKSKSTKQIHKKKGTKPKDVFPDWEPPDPLDYD